MCDSLKFKVENHYTHPLLHSSINWSIYSHIIHFSMHPFIHLTIHPFIHSSIRLFNPSHPVSYLSVSLCHDKLSTSTSDPSPLCLFTFVATCLSTCLRTDHKSTSMHLTESYPSTHLPVLCSYLFTAYRCLKVMPNQYHRSMRELQACQR